ncbi:NAD(P)-binding domain-containing protein [uncultured Brevundimonas sp.]|uniref:NAD(P)-binding domain-containing protein n=1 Tax=uncultured Brevundimonas sp. TaxID=213418 RepID=UPI00261E4CE9|nr:NAD(P)-binding domain-containing protein [uncultured Brevundimonas sp.]HRJ63002.1 NAD(P)-binding domain-containing protein [Brevundimonas sp.]
MNSSAEIISRLQNKVAVIGIVGLGYVGLPLAVRLNEVGYKVLWLDIFAAKAERLNEGLSLIETGFVVGGGARAALRSRGHHG